MSTLNKIVIVSTLAIGMQVATYALEYKKEVETIVHFAHKVSEQENASAAEVVQWLEEKVIANDYPAEQNILVINAIITGNYSMDQKIEYLLEIKDEQDNAAKKQKAQLKQEKEEREAEHRERTAQWQEQHARDTLKACAIGLSVIIFSPAIMQSSFLVGDDLGKRIVAWFNKPAPVAPRKPGHADDYTGATN